MYDDDPEYQQIEEQPQRKQQQGKGAVRRGVEDLGKKAGRKVVNEGASKLRQLTRKAVTSLGNSLNGMGSGAASTFAGVASQVLEVVGAALAAFLLVASLVAAAFIAGTIMISVFFIIIQNSSYIVPPDSATYTTGSEGEETEVPTFPGQVIPPPDGCPAPFWPVLLGSGQRYYVNQGPGGRISHNSTTANPDWPYSEAIDIHPASGQSLDPTMYLVLATHPGIVSAAGVDSWGGEYVWVNSDCALKFKTEYVHMSVLSVEVGNRIKTGDVIGVMGCTGHCASKHVHYEFLEAIGNIPKSEAGNDPPRMVSPYIPVTVPRYCAGNCGVNIQ